MSFSIFPYPRILKAAAFGILAFFLTVITGGVWTVLLIANLTTSPTFPWAVIVMAVLLWLGWQYLGGSWPPRATAEARRRYRRARPLPRQAFLWALGAGGLAITALAGTWIVLFQLVKVPGNALPDFTKYPLVLVALVVLMASIVTSVAEEVSFRGYFQSVLEREVGGPAAIIIAALVISPAHGITQGFGWPTLLFYLLVDVTFGVSAFLTDTILPGIVVHAVGLLAFFTLVWPHDAGRRLVSNGGADAWFWIHAAQAILFTALAILAFRHLAKIVKPERAVSLSET